MKKQEPYIDYKTANVLAWMFTFMDYFNQACKIMHEDLESMINRLRMVQVEFEPRTDLNECYDKFERDHFTNLLARLRHDAQEAGLTEALFEKMKDRQFQNRFRGLGFPPVQREEVEERLEENPGDEA